MPRKNSSDRREIRLSIPNDRRMIGPLIEMLLELGQRSGVLSEREVRSRTGVALEEALVNAVIHGNLEVSSQLRDLNDDSFEKMIALRIEKSPYKSRRVQIVAEYSPTEVTFSIRDEGQGFNVNSIVDPLSDDFKSRLHGRGLLLIRSFMDEVSFNEEGNCITLVKRKQSAEPTDCIECQNLSEHVAVGIK